jgi:soluble lytic murein transglycosylase-like protein
VICHPAVPHERQICDEQALFPHILEHRFMIFMRAKILGLAFMGAGAILIQPSYAMTRAELDALVAAQAAANGVPVTLVHRVIIRESRYNPRLVGKGGAMGLMQIKAATARGVGYGGSAAGLLDPQTNLTYAVRYLAGAYRLAGGNHDRAVSYYARGYYYAAKGKGQTVEALAVPGGQSLALVPAVAVAATPAAGKRVVAYATAVIDAKRDREP